MNDIDIPTKDPAPAASAAPACDSPPDEFVTAALEYLRTVHGLTERNLQVWRLLLTTDIHSSNKHLSRTLNISVVTVKYHISRVLRSLGVHSRLQAVLTLATIAVRNAARIPR